MTDEERETLNQLIYSTNLALSNVTKIQVELQLILDAAKTLDKTLEEKE